MTTSCEEDAALVGPVSLFCGVETWNWNITQFLDMATWAKQHGVSTLFIKVSEVGSKAGDIWYGGFRAWDVIYQELIKIIPVIAYAFPYGDQDIQKEISVAIYFMQKYGAFCLDMEGARWSTPDAASRAKQFADALTPIPGKLWLSCPADPVRNNQLPFLQAMSPAVNVYMPMVYDDDLAGAWQPDFAQVNPGACLQPTLDLSQEFGANNVAHIVQQMVNNDIHAISLWYEGFAKQNPTMLDDIVAEMKGGMSMPPTTPGGENAVFHDNVTQLEGGETEDACVAFAASNVWHSVQPGKVNPYSYEDIDSMADTWYSRLTGSITNSDGMSEGQLHTMLSGMGLVYEPISLSHTSDDDEKVRVALRAGKLVIICAAESSFFDLEIGRPPYSWNTQPFNHAIVASGLITSGQWAGNVWVRDTVAVSGGYPPSTKRPYDLGKMQYVSLTAVVPAWLKGAITMSGLPTGAKDNGKDTITFSNGHVMVNGFRAKYNDMAAKGLIPTDDLALENEHHEDAPEKNNPSFWPKGGNVQSTRFFRFAWSPEHGVVWTYIGAELLWYQAHQAAPPPPVPLPQGTPQAVVDDISKLVAGFEQLKKDAGVI